MTIKDTLPTVAYPLGKKLELGDSELTFSLDSVKKMIPVTKLPYSEADAESSPQVSLSNVYTC